MQSAMGLQRPAPLNPAHCVPQPPQLHRPQHRWASGSRRDTVAAMAITDTLSSCQPGDLLQANTTAGREELLEVVSPCEGGRASVVVGWKGQLLSLTPNQDYLAVENVGYYPAASSVLLQKVPQFKAHLESCQQQSDAVSWRVSALETVSSVQQLSQAVATDPSLWCDGTRPGAPQNSPLASATLTAGELLALMAGHRGIVTVQLWNGWDKAQGQPLYDPLTLRVLEQALLMPELACIPSVAPGGVGLTAILHVNREPWSAWARHLAGFGMQANIVAGSPYYKLLIGRMLGYNADNVRGYVAATSVPGSVGPALVAEVEAEMKKLSKAKAKLPWNNAGGSRGKKKVAAAGAAR